MGSDSDLPVMEEASKILENFGVVHEVIVASAHRSPERTRKYTLSAPERGIKVLIAGAGGAAGCRHQAPGQQLAPRHES